MAFDVDTSELERAQRELDRLQRELLDLRPLWSRVDELAGDWAADQFRSAGRWGGTPWQPLSPAYAARKAERHGSRPTLVATGGLFDAATRPRADAEPDRLELEIEHPLAAIHSAGGGDLPARPLFPEELPSSAQRELDDEAQEYVDGLLAGLRL